MNLALAERLRCPACRAARPDAHSFEEAGRHCVTGVIVCRGCAAWYPISGRVLDLLPGDRAKPGARARFFDAHRARMEELGLQPPAANSPDGDFAAQEQQREHFDGLSHRDDRFSYRALGLQPFQRAIRSLNFEEWAPLIRPGSMVLDIGCADGLSTFDVARFGVEALGLDISGGQVALAAARAEREGVENVSFMIADADALPVADGAVDGVLCYGCLHHVPSPERTLAEAARVLREDGSYLGVENNVTPLRPIFDALMKLRPIWLEEAGPQAQIGAGQLDRWTAETDLRLKVSSIVFVPPHLCNWIGFTAARGLLRLTNRLFRRVPVVRNWGGLISITGRERRGSGSTGSSRPSRDREAHDSAVSESHT